ncbi:MAG: hypothetical protein M3275_13615 [Thermoproteota archaeon]|nr:hypothetical protein [Thermoproteota archaeon]
MVTIFAVFTNNRNTSIKERENSALATVQHNAYAMNILRSRLESRINFIISKKGKTDHYQELAWMLELVEKGELILNVISDRIDSVQYFDEFITIISNVSSSMSEVRDDVEQTVEAAEASLSGLHDAISKVSTQLLPDLRQEIEPALIFEVSTVLAPGKTNTANFTANEATVMGATEKEEDGKGERNEQAESMMA